VQAVSAAITAQRRAPLASVADWYSWSRAGQLYLDLLNTISAQPPATRRAAAAAGRMDVAAKVGE